MIEVERLSKSYGAFLAVSELTFRVKKGEVVGFLGPNGAGKSTTLRMLSGFLGATSGQAFVNGHSVIDEPLKARASIGYMPESSPLYLEMRVREYLAFRAELKGVPAGKRRAGIDKAIEDAGLTEVADVIIGQLSKGFRQRVGLADALVASPPLLILDEPTAGLDPNQVREVRALIARLKERHTVLVSTHILSEVEAMCSRGVVIARGKLVADGTLDELRALARPESFRLRVRGHAQGIKKALSDVEGLAEIEVSGPKPKADEAPAIRPVTLHLSSPSDHVGVIERAVAALSAAGLGVSEVMPSSSLEQVFSELTRDAQR